MVRPSSLQDAITKALGGGGAQGAAGGRVSFLDELGVLVITDSPRNIRAVEDIVNAVIRERDRLSLHRFELMHLNAEVAREKVLTLRARAGRPARCARPASPLARAKPRAQAVPGASGGSLSSLPDRLLSIRRATRSSSAGLRRRRRRSSRSSRWWTRPAA